MNAPIDPPRPPVHHSSPTTGPHTPKASQPPFRTCLESRATTTPSHITLQLLVGTNFLRFLKLHWTVLYCAVDLTMKPHTTFLFLCKLVDRSKPEYSKQISHVSADQTEFTFDCSNPSIHLSSCIHYWGTVHWLLHSVQHWVSYWVVSTPSIGKGTEYSEEETTTAGAHSLSSHKGHRPLSSSRNQPDPNLPHPGTVTGLTTAPKILPHQRCRSSCCRKSSSSSWCCCQFLCVPTPRAARRGKGAASGESRARCGASDPRLFCCCSYRRTQDGDWAMCSATHTVQCTWCPSPQTLDDKIF